MDWGRTSFFKRTFFSAAVCRLLIAIACVVLPPAAFASPITETTPGNPCILVAPSPLVTAERFEAMRKFDCSSSAGAQSGVITYAWFRNLRLLNTVDDSLEFRHSSYQTRDERLWVRFGDGRVIASATSLMDARRLYSAGMLVYKLPISHVAITDILVRADEFAGERGVGENATVMTAAAGQHQDITFLLIFSLLGGALAALFIYNIALYRVLRYPFILAHCASTLSVMMFALSWSGAIFYFIPDMTPRVQISIIFVSGALFILSLTMFMLTFIERETLRMISIGLPIIFATITVSSALVGMLAYRSMSGVLIEVYYLSFFGALVTMLLCAGIAWRNGSRSARYYLLVWTVPVAVALARVLWAFGMFNVNSVFAETSPTFIMVIESFMSAFAVSWRIGQLRDERDEARSTQAELTRLAGTDPLTGLLNRRAFLELARRGDQFKQFILIDIDNFKLINDTHGHDAGDRVIIAVAKALERECSANYLVGRMGGEEFGIIVPDLVPFLAQRICTSVSQLTIIDGLTVTVSAGVAIGAITTAEQWHDLYTAADLALYQAKRGGRNQVCNSALSAAA